MFQIKTDRRVWWPCVIKVPIDGGETRDHAIKVRYRLLDDGELEAALQGEAGDKGMLRAAVVDWDLVADEDGEPLAFNAETLERVMVLPYVRKALAVAFFQARVGEIRKN